MQSNKQDHDICNLSIVFVDVVVGGGVTTDLKGRGRKKGGRPSFAFTSCQAHHQHSILRVHNGKSIFFDSFLFLKLHSEINWMAAIIRAEEPSTRAPNPPAFATTPLHLQRGNVPIPSPSRTYYLRVELKFRAPADRIPPKNKQLFLA